MSIDIGGNQRNVTVDIRGFGEAAGLKYSGACGRQTVNAPDLSGTDWTQIPLDRVRKIEIIRGGRGSVLYGDNASAGSSTLLQKRAKQIKQVPASLPEAMIPTRVMRIFQATQKICRTLLMQATFLPTDTGPIAILRHRI